MAQIKTFSIWIYNQDQDQLYSNDRLFQSSFCEPPCDGPKTGMVHLTVNATPDGQNLDGIKSAYFYGSTCDDVLNIDYTGYQLGQVTQNLVGSGSLLNRIQGLIQTLPLFYRQELIERYNPGSCRDLDANLIQLFVVQLALSLLTIAWLTSSTFWEHHLLPLYVPLPQTPGVISQHVMELVSIYLMYLYSMDDLSIEIKPCLEESLSFGYIWGDGLLPGPCFNTDMFQSVLNLGFIKYATARLSQESSPTELSHDMINLLSLQRDKIEKRASQLNRSLGSHFSTLSHEIITHAMTEIRHRLDGCVEEEVLKIHPKIDSYVESAFREKSNYFFILKKQLNLEIDQARRVCQQALLAIDRCACLEDRVKCLEEEVEVLQKSQNPALQAKVDHLQSTVTQLLRRVGCRP